MLPGKIAAQASHAACQSLMYALRLQPELLESFLAAQNSGTRLVLRAPRPWHLHDAYDAATRLALPCALFHDSGPGIPEPILTACAIGPAPRDLISPIIKRFNCV